MSTAIPDRYLRTDDFASRVEGLTFPPEVWAVFAHLEQPRASAELVSALGFEEGLVEAAFQLLLDHKLVRKHVLSWRDFAGSAQVSSVPVATAPPPAPQPPVRDVPVIPPSPPKVATGPLSSSAPISYRWAAALPARLRNTATVSLRVVSSGGSSTPLPARSPGASRWRLLPVLDLIRAKAGGGLAGQLLIYRVFLHVPAELMRAGGLHSISLVDEHLVVNHPRLRDAIATAARSQAQIEVAHLLSA